MPSKTQHKTSAPTPERAPEYAAARTTFAEAVTELRREQYSKAVALFAEAHKKALREEEILKKLKNLRTSVLDGGATAQRAAQVRQDLESGTLASDETLEALASSAREERAILAAVQRSREHAQHQNVRYGHAQTKRLEALGELKNGAFDLARFHADAAADTTQPPLRYLMDNAHRLAADGVEKANTADVDAALHLWNKSLNEYARAKVLAEHERNAAALEWIDGNLETVQSNIQNALRTLSDADRADDADTTIVRETSQHALMTARLNRVEDDLDRAERYAEKNDPYRALETYKTALRRIYALSDEPLSLGALPNIAHVTHLIERSQQGIGRAETAMALRKKAISPTTHQSHPTTQPTTSIQPTRSHPAPAHPLTARYEALKRIGHTESADVFYAHENGHPVLLKVPHTRGSAGSERFFFNEILQWQQLNHRNIVRLIAPRLEPLPHLVLEYVDGESLATLITRKSLSVVDTCRVIHDAATGLAHAHAQHVLHCTLTPENIIVSHDGTAKVTDFGLALRGDTAIRDAVIPYAAPEQYDEARIVDEKTDVYQLGAVFYAALTGAHPREHDGEMRMPSDYAPELKPLDALICGCLDTIQEQRPTARAFRDGIAVYVKKYHGEQLHHETDYATLTRLHLERAFDRAQQGDLPSCYLALGRAHETATGEAKLEIAALREHVVYMIQERITPESSFFTGFEALLSMVA